MGKLLSTLAMFMNNNKANEPELQVEHFGEHHLFANAAATSSGIRF